jgi:hypothetical protein
MRANAVSIVVASAAIWHVAAATEPVRVLLYGPSAEIQRHVDQLPLRVEYQRMHYQAQGMRHGRTLLIGVSGGIERSELSRVLEAVRIQEWWGAYADPWRIAIRGDARYARITVSNSTSNECNPPSIWYAVKDDGQWVVFYGPGTPSMPVPKPCEYVPPPMITP